MINSLVAALSLVLPLASASADLGFACNPLAPPSSSCMLPWPDDFFRSTTWDAGAAPTLLLRNASLPVSDAGAAIDPVAGGWDGPTGPTGFSPLGPIVAYLPGLSLELSALPRLWSVGDGGARLALVNAATGARVPCWAELDHSGDSATDPTPYERALLIWPAVRLEDGTEYLVALRNATDDAGSLISPSDGFRALVYGIPTQDPAVEQSRARFERIFALLAAAPLGFPRRELTLAWSFTTNSRADLTQRMLHMRDDAFARIAADNGGSVRYTIGQVEEAPAPGVARRVHGQFFVPCYLPDDALPSLGSHLVLDAASGLPVFQSLTPFDFEIVIPASVANGSRAAAGVLQYGHGLFGDHGEVEEGYLADQADAAGWVLAATDWIGLSEYDEPTVIVMLASNFTEFRIVPDRLHQGMLNSLVLMRMLAPGQAFLADKALAFAAAPAGVVSLNASQRFYTGNSQGGIMGAVYLAASTDVVQGVLGVGGAPYALLLPRSTDFGALFDLLRVRYPRSLDRMLSIAFFQLLWDRMDGSGWSAYITAPSGAAGGAGVLPGTPSHRAVWHYGLGDAQVSWLGCHLASRAAGAVMFASNVHEGNETLAQFAKVADDAVVRSGNVVMGFDFGFPDVPFVNVPPSDGHDAHECPRRAPNAQAQMRRFFETGDIVNTCGGACVSAPTC